MMLGAAVVWLQFPLSARVFHGRMDDDEAKAVLGHSTLPVAGGGVKGGR